MQPLLSHTSGWRSWSSSVTGQSSASYAASRLWEHAPHSLSESHDVVYARSYSESERHGALGESWCWSRSQAVSMTRSS